MEEVMQILERQILGNSLYLWALSLGLFCGLYLVLRMSLAWIGSRARKSSLSRTRLGTAFVEALSRFSRLFVLVAALYLAAIPLAISQRAHQFLDRLLILGLLLQMAFWGKILLRSWLDFLFSRNGSDASTQNTVGLISSLAQGGLYVTLGLLALNNLGVDITALVAGLGVGGIAVALAAQNILGDLFASLTIVLDRPFQVGDAIKVGESVGTVEHIGLKTTRLRSVNGEQLVFPNAHLLQNQINNFRRMKERRVLSVLNVTYETPVEKLERIPALVQEVISAQTGSRFERAHFKGYGPSSLDFEVLYWIEDPDYTRFMNIQQAVNFGILKGFQREGIGFAYPTQTVFVNRVSPTDG